MANKEDIVLQIGVEGKALKELISDLEKLEAIIIRLAAMGVRVDMDLTDIKMTIN